MNSELKSMDLMASSIDCRTIKSYNKKRPFLNVEHECTNKENCSLFVDGIPKDNIFYIKHTHKDFGKVDLNNYNFAKCYALSYNGKDGKEIEDFNQNESIQMNEDRIIPLSDTLKIKEKNLKDDQTQTGEEKKEPFSNLAIDSEGGLIMNKNKIEDIKSKGEENEITNASAKDPPKVTEKNEDQLIYDDTPNVVQTTGPKLTNYTTGEGEDKRGNLDFEFSKMKPTKPTFNTLDNRLKNYKEQFDKDDRLESSKNAVNNFIKFRDDFNERIKVYLNKDSSIVNNPNPFPDTDDDFNVKQKKNINYSFKYNTSDTKQNGFNTFGDGGLGTLENHKIKHRNRNVTVNDAIETEEKEAYRDLLHMFKKKHGKTAQRNTLMKNSIYPDTNLTYNKGYSSPNNYSLYPCNKKKRTTGCDFSLNFFQNDCETAYRDDAEIDGLPAPRNVFELRSRYFSSTNCSPRERIRDINSMMMTEEDKKRLVMKMKGREQNKVLRNPPSYAWYIVDGLVYPINNIHESALRIDHNNFFK